MLKIRVAQSWFALSATLLFGLAGQDPTLAATTEDWKEDIQKIDQKRYGEVTDLLLAPLPDHPEDTQAQQSSKTSDVSPPEILKRHRPHFPEARRNRGRTVTVIVQCIIDTDGLPYNPQLRQASGEYTMVLSALETLGKWRFKPATRNGQPVRVIYNLSVNFKAP